MLFSRFQQSVHRSALAALALGVVVSQGAAQQASAPAETAVSRTSTPAYDFSPEDEKLLDDIQRGCFNYLWNEVGYPSGMVKDRRTTLVASMAGVGFQLSSLPIAVERGWITRDEGRDRALSILHALQSAGPNRRFGVFLHFVNVDSGAIYPPYNNEISTVDHSLFLAGALPAATYFQGEVADIVNQIAAETNWKAFQVPHSGLINFGWDLDDNANAAGPGRFKSNEWRLATDEERLIYFMAAGSPTAEFAVEPRSYYLLERNIGLLGDMPPFVLSYNGALFTYFFASCWINYRYLAADNPRDFGVDLPGIDWFENSRRATLAHRQACIDRSGRYSTLATDRWGLSPCMGQEGDVRQWNYIVPDLPPNLSGREQIWRGTVAPYAAGSAIMFTPEESMDALRAFRALTGPDGKPFIWRDPAGGGFAFADSFNLDQGVACDDNVAIDAGPLILAIENVRTGLIWRLFGEHEHARRSYDRLKLKPLQE